MRYHILRFDIWLCLAIGFLISLGTSKLATFVLNEKYEEHKQEHKVEFNEIGGVAGEDIVRAQNIADLLSHDKFTVVSPGIEYRNKGAGYYQNFYLYALTLPSGEVVAARINGDSVIHKGDSIYSGDNILPVGKVVYADLTESSNFLTQIEHSISLDRKDFYVDMVGNAAIESEESFIEVPVLLVQLLTIFLSFPLFHWCGSKFGIFPSFFS